MRYLKKIVYLALLVSFTSQMSLAQERLIGARYPALSPDGQKIAFSYIGDIWIVSKDGGKAEKLSNNVAYEQRPVWSPDGRQIAFTSNRLGNNNIYLISSSGGDPVQLTYNSGTDIATDFSPDGNMVYFRSNRSSSSGIFKIKVSGGNAEPVLDTYWSYPYWAKVSPDNSGILFSHGPENGYWWRRGYKGANSAKIWSKKFNSSSAEKLVADMSNSFWPAWGQNGNSLYYVSDKQYNNKNIWVANKDGSNPKAVTKFRDGDILWMSVAKNTDTAVYERNFGIWTTDLTTGKSTAIRIDLPIETKANSTFYVNNANVSEFMLSPDGKKIAAVVRGEIFVMAEDGGYARNITNTPWRERNVSWDKESKNIFYVSDVNAQPDIYMKSALGTGAAKKITNTPADELNLSLSPDGESIVYYSGPRHIRIMKSDGTQDRLLVEDDFGGRFADGYSWSPDSKFLAYVSGSANSDIHAINIASGDITKMTDTAYDENNPVWADDGKALYFSSNRYGHSFPEFTGKWDIYKLSLKPEMPEFDEDDFEELFANGDEEKSEDDKNDKKDGDVRVEPNIEDISLQTTTITNTLGNDRRFVIHKEKLLFVSNIDGRNHFWQRDLKKGNPFRYTPYATGVFNPSNLQKDSKNKFLYYRSGGKISKLNLSSAKSEPISFSTRILVNKTADYEQMLGELFYTLQHYYYDENHHNLDWSDTHDKFLPVLTQVREDQDFYDYANLMIGFLNSSHTGIRSPFTGGTPDPSAHMGLSLDFSGNAIKIKDILKNSPLYFHRESVSEGDELTAINGMPVSPNENIWKMLNGNMNKRLTLTIKNQGTAETKDIAIKPVSRGAESRLMLEEWITSRRDIVKKNTNDDVAYLYMRAMGRGDLNRFLVELERDAVPRKGLILDLRWNNGGNVHDRVIEALTKPVYAKWKIRGLSETQQSTFGFADKPIVILTNERTLSDGEMTASGLKTLKRGKIVGNTTYGWLIFTTSAGLMNGGSFRLPFWGCFTLDGENLETSGGVVPDILVINDLNDELNDTDPQLDRAIQEIKRVINK